MLDTEMWMSKPLQDLKAKVILQSNKYGSLEKKERKKKVLDLFNSIKCYTDFHQKMLPPQEQEYSSRKRWAACF